MSNEEIEFLEYWNRPPIIKIKKLTAAYYHHLAWIKFGKRKCQICEKSNKEEIEDIGKRLSMHCTSKPKNYSIIKKSNWMCLC